MKVSTQLTPLFQYCTLKISQKTKKILTFLFKAVYGINAKLGMTYSGFYKHFFKKYDSGKRMLIHIID